MQIDTKLYTIKFMARISGKSLGTNSVSDLWVPLFIVSFSVSVIRQARYPQLDFKAWEDTLLLFVQGFSFFLCVVALIVSDWNSIFLLIKKIVTNRNIQFLLIFVFIQTCRSPGNILNSLLSNFYLIFVSFGFYVLSASRWRNYAKRNFDTQILLFAFSLVLSFGLLISFLQETTPARLRGLIEGPNFLGFYSSIFLLLLVLCKISGITFNRTYYIYLISVGTISLEGSGSRASTVTLVFFLFILMIISEDNRKQIYTFAAVAMVVAILFILVNGLYPNYIKTLESGAQISVTNSGYTSTVRILRIDPKEGDGGIFTGRVGIWKLYGEKVIEAPIFGYGFNPVVSPESIFPHNILILLAYQFGIPFTIILCYMFFRLFNSLNIGRKYILLNVLVFLVLNSLFADFVFGIGSPVWALGAVLIVSVVHSSGQAP